MSEWKKFTGSDGQLDEIRNAKNGWVVRTKYGRESSVHSGALILNCTFVSDIAEYLICEIHPHAEMINRWIKTGQPVYYFDCVSNR